MSATIVPIQIPIHQGASLEEDFERFYFPYEVEWDCGRWVNKCTGQEAPLTDMVEEDYTGCQGIAVLVPEIGSTVEIDVFSTSNGRLILDGHWVRFRLSSAETAALQYGTILPEWNACVAYVYITRPSGTVEPHYLASFTLVPGTPTAPAP